eukprot:CAMPEP_0198200878 /NCGR_PEP_ID=MMETSP1445-20131203/3782_1 /TAXON_ID=36898 /ORGANISM="Pyramimonas sp., Strain CCMP2087" /LENGTH=164 /DNA_ID=CAMNT_0043871045 /DNA_START=221 /DNA_END=715 /DNA_ORIENTATION=-
MEVPEMQRIIQDSWAKIRPIEEGDFTYLPLFFYPKLFELDPTTKPLFEDITMENQGKKLMLMLNVAVDGVEDLDSLVKLLTSLGRRHAMYGCTEEQYDAVGQALIFTLASGLGKEFTPRVKEAWLMVYGIIVGVMIPAMAAEYEEMSFRSIKKGSSTPVLEGST